MVVKETGLTIVLWGRVLLVKKGVVCAGGRGGDEGDGETA